MKTKTISLNKRFWLSSTSLCAAALIAPALSAEAATNCSAWQAQSYPKGSCVTYEGKTYETQWWANAEDVPYIGPNPWDSPWILSSDDGGNPDPDDGGNPDPDDGGNPDNDQIPSQARINWMESNWASGQSIPFAWTLDWGTPGTSWEVQANGSSIYQSTQFDSTTQTSQTGSTNLNLADGNYNLTLKLCTDAGCSESAATNIIVGADQSQMPTAPDVSAIANINQGADIPVVWNMWWGEIGSSWNVVIDGNQVYSSQSFTKNEANVQAGQADIDSSTLNLSDGSHNLAVQLCNGSLCSEGTTTFTIGGDVPPPPADSPTKPVVDPIADSTEKAVTLTWNTSDNGEDEFVKGTTWSVQDTFNGTTSVIFPSTSSFTSDTATAQSGQADLTLNNGDHLLTVQLCSTPSTCTISDPVSVNIDTPPAPTPTAPMLENIPAEDEGKITINWHMNNGTPGTYWEIWNGSTRLQKLTSFTVDEATAQAGTTTKSLSNGSYALSVKLCNEDDVCSESNTQSVTISNAPENDTVFVAYYPTWVEPSYWASSDQSPENDQRLTDTSLLAGGIPDYVTHVVLSFGKLNEMHNYKGISGTHGDLLPLGIQVNTSSGSLVESIRVLKQNNPGIKVLLALGGASYNDSWSNVTQDDIDQLAQLITDLGLDGLDVDYEITGSDSTNVNKYYQAIVDMRAAIDKANENGAQAILSIAGWSTGADCTAQTQGANYPQCDGKVSFWGGSAGRERQVLQGKGAADMIDLIAVMSYDASYKNFDPVVAYNQYREIAKPDAIVALGIQPPMDEGWGEAITLTDDLGTTNNACSNNVVETDQYGNALPGTFSVERFANAVKQNPGDGMMMWSLFAYRDLNAISQITGCPVNLLNTVTEIGQGVSEYLGIGSDRTTQIDWETAINYGR